MSTLPDHEVFVCDTIVIGAGVTGLATAYYLAKDGVSVKVLEANTVGGVIRTEYRNGFTLECGPNVFLEKHNLPELINELGLEVDRILPIFPDYQQYVWNERTRSILAVPRGPLALLKTPLLTLSEKLRAVRGLWKRFPIGHFGDDISVHECIGQLLGYAVVDAILEPALQGIYGSPTRELSARTLFPILWGEVSQGQSMISWMRNRRASKPGGAPQIFALRSGNATLIKALESALPEGSIEHDEVCEITPLGPESGGFLVRGKTREWRARRVVITSSGSVTASLIKAIEPSLAGRLAQFAFVPLTVVHCSVPKDFPWYDRGFGVLFPPRFRRGLLGVMANSVIFPSAAPKGEHLLTVMLHGDPSLRSSGESWEEAALSSLRDELGISHGVLVLEVTEWKRAIPQFAVGTHVLHEEMNAVEQKYPGLFFAGVDRGGVGVPDRVAMAQRVADKSRA